jgi:serine/threonine protein kinase
MELVEGVALGDKLEKHGRLGEDEALRILAQVAHGLHRAHRQGLIHRDIKPDNILVTADGKAKLTDLGLAKDSDAGGGLTRTGRGLGTPVFMAPEQFRDAKNASIRCDVYSLAATLYQMVTGHLPFDAEDPIETMKRKLRNELTPPRRLAPGLSARTDAAIMRAMSADPEQRPASCREFVEDLLGQRGRPGSEYAVLGKGPAPSPNGPAGESWQLPLLPDPPEQSPGGAPAQPVSGRAGAADAAEPAAFVPTAPANSEQPSRWAAAGATPPARPGPALAADKPAGPRPGPAEEAASPGELSGWWKAALLFTLTALGAAAAAVTRWLLP